MCDFLNTLDEKLPCLLRKTSWDIITSDPIGGVNLLVLHNNEYAILNRIAFMIVKKHVGIDRLSCRENFFDNSSPEKGSFISSDYHFEFELTEQSLERIRHTIKNKPIFTNEFIFMIKNATSNVNRNLYLELRRLIDTNSLNNVSRWIITMERHTFLEKSVQSRALMVNCCFPLENILQCCNLPQPKEDYHQTFIKSKGNVINFLQLLSSSASSLMWQDAFDKFMSELIKEKKQINVIASSREMVYKLYHIGVPLAEFCRYVILKYGDDVKDIVPMIATCEHQSTKNNECLLYEKVILEVYKHMFSSTMRKPKQQKKERKVNTKAVKNI